MLARLLLILVLFLVLINLLVKVVIPWRFRKMAEKMNNQDQKRGFFRNNNKEGKTTVQGNAKQNSGKYSDEGEYVDYEEIKD
jgi:hypothetical protein